jgi:L-arabinokinase
VEFLELLPTLRDADDRPFFDPGREISVARAPGRLDVMGGVADYSGSLVLQMPIRAGVFAAVQLRSGRAVHVMSLGHHGTPARVASREDLTVERSYREERARFAEPSTRWAGYALGAFTVLAREREARFPCGASVCIGSTVPEGRGVASSAAIEVAAMSAISGAFGLGASAHEIAVLCHLLENEIVGVPCGPMDQFAVALGEDSRLLALLCRPAQQLPFVDLPDGLVVLGVDSGASHSNAGRAYRRARVAAFMGRRILEHEHGPLEYLTELEPRAFRAHEDRLPDAISGEDYTRRYGGVDDAHSLVEPSLRYLVRAAVRHAVEEHARVQEFAELLPGAHSRADRVRLGALMNLSHESYSACGLGSTATDEVAQALVALPGVYGARVTGGGSGGTVASLVAADGVGAVTDAMGVRGLSLFIGSSPGTHSFGVRHASLTT